MPDIVASILGTTAVSSIFGILVIGFLKLVLKQQSLNQLEMQRKENEKEQAETFQKT